MKLFSWIGGICAVALMVGGAAPVSAATTATETETATVTEIAEATEDEHMAPIALVTEPNEIDSKVYYYDGAKKVQPEDFTWVAGKTGNAVRLNGSTQYLRYSSAQTLKLESFTFVAWVNWQGDTEDTVGQRLFTVYRNENRFITVSPHMQNEEAGVNGLYAEWQDRSIEPITLFAKTGSATTTELERGAWHHVAVKVSPVEFSVYVDGTLQYTVDNSDAPVVLTDMRLNTFVVGRGIGDEPYLNALLDDAYLYPEPLSNSEVALLAAGMNPADGGTAPTSTAYLATRPRTTTVAGSAASGERTTVFGLPVMLVVIPVAVALAAVVLSLVFSAQKRRDTQPLPDGEETPTILDGGITPPEAPAAEQPVAEPEPNEEKEGDAE